MTARPVPALVACLVALGYARWRRLVRGVRGLGSRPWALVLTTLLIVTLAAADLYLLGTAASRPPGRSGPAGGDLVAVVTAAIPLLPPLLILTAGRRSPLRLAAADATWLLTAPAGDRAVLVRHLLAAPARVALVGLTAGVLARSWAGLPVGPAWTLAVVAATGALAFRLASTAGHAVAVGLRARGRTAARVLAGAFVMAGLSTHVTDVPAVETATLVPVARLLVTAVLDPAASNPAALLALTTTLLVTAAALAARAKAVTEPAEAAARRADHAAAVLSRSRGGDGLNNDRLRSGIPSLTGHPVFAAERAAMFRAWAHERRTWRETVVLPVIALSVMTVLLLVSPSSAWIPAGMLVMNVLTTAVVDGAAVELDHQRLWTAPLRPTRVLAWANLVGFGRSALTLEAAWLLLLAGPQVDARIWAAGALLLACGCALAAAAGSLAAVVAARLTARLALAAGLIAAAALPSAVLAVAGHGSVPAVLAGAAALVAAAGAMLAVAGAAWTSRVGGTTAKRQIGAAA